MIKELYNQRVLDFYPENKITLNNMGWFCQCKGELEAAVEFYSWF